MAPICITHEPSPGYPLTRYEGQPEHDEQQYGVCQRCCQLIVRFTADGVWVLSNARHHPYRSALRDRPQSVSGF